MINNTPELSYRPNTVSLLYAPFLGRSKIKTARFLILLLLIHLPCSVASSFNSYPSYISTTAGKGYFPLAVSGKPAPLYVSQDDHKGVIRVAKLLQTDINKVTSFTPDLSLAEIPRVKAVVIIGTLGKNRIIDKLTKAKKLNLTEINGKRETFLIQVLKDPLPGVDQALIIVGSDKRGTIYGMLDLSTQIGVSPWYWWADVPIEKKNALYVLPGRHTMGEPAVKYRGIFINDEAPALAGWAQEHFGGFNAGFYEKVFELILRLKGNYLWPAMWGSAFYADDTRNPKLADEYGIVVGTSHHEPMMRAHDEWRRFGSGDWNYETNEKKLREFWREGIRRMDGYESVVTVGMRGDGDKPMSDTTAISLLERIVKDQRTILKEETGKPLSSIPQKWALYKEVQDYYDQGMRVPDDVTLLLCDDNWGNVRRLPRLDQPKRSGGYGMYYHFDFVGGPRSYRWLNTNTLPRIWEQMHLSYRYGVEEIWIVNVGDIKPMEFPTQFFLDYAWNPEKWPAARLPDYTKSWVKQQFGEKHANEIADILTKYTKYNGRRKPELLDPFTYSLTNYKEAETVVSDYNTIAQKAETIYHQLPEQYKDAFYQLILHPTKACSNLNEMYVTTGKNHLYAKQGRAATNTLASKVKTLFDNDAEITRFYHSKLSDGKWNHMMSQTHIGYTSWNNPPENIMPEVETITLANGAKMGVAIEGSDSWWPAERENATLPEYDRFNRQKYYLEIFNRGNQPFDYTAHADKPWVLISDNHGKIEMERRIWASIAWDEVPAGRQTAVINITGPDNNDIPVNVVVNNPELSKRTTSGRFIESNGYISIEAEHYTKEIGKNGINWLTIPDFGRTLSGVTPLPVTAEKQTPGKNTPRLEYGIYLFNSGSVTVKAYFSPTQNFHNTEGLHYGVSFDDENPKLINAHKNETVPDWKYPQWWNQEVSNNIKITASDHIIKKAGKHTLKFWMVDPGLVLQKIVVETRTIPSSYLGPPESVRN